VRANRHGLRRRDADPLEQHEDLVLDRLARPQQPHLRLALLDLRATDIDERPLAHGVPRPARFSVSLAGRGRAGERDLRLRLQHAEVLLPDDRLENGRGPGDVGVGRVQLGPREASRGDRLAGQAVAEREVPPEGELVPGVVTVRWRKLKYLGRPLLPPVLPEIVAVA